MAAGRKQQVKVEALIQQGRTAALEEAGEELQLLKQEKDAALKVILTSNIEVALCVLWKSF